MSNLSNLRRYLKIICVHLMRAELYLSVALIGCTIGLQLYNLFSPPVVSTEIPYEIGEIKLPFQITAATAMPFLMIPLLGLVLVAIFLNYFFSRNGSLPSRNFRSHTV